MLTDGFLPYVSNYNMGYLVFIVPMSFIPGYLVFIVPMSFIPGYLVFIMPMSFIPGYNSSTMSIKGSIFDDKSNIDVLSVSCLMHAIGD